MQSTACCLQSPSAATGSYLLTLKARVAAADQLLQKTHDTLDVAVFLDKASHQTGSADILTMFTAAAIGTCSLQLATHAEALLPCSNDSCAAAKKSTSLLACAINPERTNLP